MIPLRVADRILDFWLRTTPEDQWFAPGPGLDAALARRFRRLWQGAKGGACDGWLATPAGALALLLLLDQFPRNMFRGRAAAFASDAKARAIARRALVLHHDLRWPERERQFFYLPFEHSESLADQDLSVTLFTRRMRGSAENHLHARAHRVIVRRFGRFPGRNAALGRATTAEEAEWLAAGGYGAAVRAVRHGQG